MKKVVSLFTKIRFRQTRSNLTFCSSSFNEKNYLEKPPELELERPEATEAEEATRKQEQTPTHNLYLCNDVSCQRILKTMLLQKFDDLKSHIVEDKSTTAVAGMASLTILRASTFFEDYLITIVKYLSQKKWKPVLGKTCSCPFVR